MLNIIFVAQCIEYSDLKCLLDHLNANIECLRPYD